MPVYVPVYEQRTKNQTKIKERESTLKKKKPKVWFTQIKPQFMGKPKYTLTFTHTHTYS